MHPSVNEAWSLRVPPGSQKHQVHSQKHHGALHSNAKHHEALHSNAKPRRTGLSARTHRLARLRRQGGSKPALYSIEQRSVTSYVQLNTVHTRSSPCLIRASSPWIPGQIKLAKSAEGETVPDELLAWLVPGLRSRVDCAPEPRFNLADVLVPVSACTRISARLKCVQRHVSRVNIRPCRLATPTCAC